MADIVDYAKKASAKSDVWIGIQVITGAQAPSERFFCARVMVGCVGAPSGAPSPVNGNANLAQPITQRLASAGDGIQDSSQEAPMPTQFYKLNAQYLISPEATAEELINDTSIFLAMLYDAINAEMNRDDIPGPPPCFYLLEAMVEMARSTIEEAQSRALKEKAA